MAYVQSNYNLSHLHNPTYRNRRTKCWRRCVAAVTSRDTWFVNGRNRHFVGGPP